jgi:glycerophosphoryl diester phosphodiesterase
MRKKVHIFHREIEVKVLLEVLAVKIILALILAGVYLLEPTITGFITVSKVNDYTDDVNLEFDESGVYVWNMQKQGALKGIRIDGSKSKEGNAKIYIEKGNVTYLIFDSSQLVKKSSGLFGITGFVVKEDKKEKDEIKAEVEGNLNEEQQSLFDSLILDINKTRNDVDVELEVKKDEVKKKVKGDLTDSQNKIIDDLAESLEGAEDKTKIKIKSEFKDPKDEEAEDENNAPVWNSDVNSFIINQTTIINLSDYYYDGDNDDLIYSSNNVTGVLTTINNEIITLVPEDNIDETEQVIFAAYDGEEIEFKTISLIINTVKINESLNQTIERKININLGYDNYEFYDANNDGVESLEGVIDFTSKNTKFNWEVDENNLCTRYEVYSVDNEESTYLCYGNSNCCAFVDLQSSRDYWNESLFLGYGSYGSTEENMVFAQVLHVDYDLSLENAYTDISYSSWKNLTASFVEDVIEFEDVCVDTCIVSGFNDSSYKLIIEVENGTLKIDEIKYTIEEKMINNNPMLIKNVENVSVIENKNYTLNLSSYFYDEDNDELNYDYYKMENISIEFKNDIAYVIPDKNFTGTRFTYIIANDSFEQVTSNMFKVEVSEEVTSLDRFEIVDENDDLLLVIDSLGNANIKGNLTENANLTADGNDFVIEYSNGDLNMVVSNPYGNLLLKGVLLESLSLLNPTPNSFIIENKVGSVIAYVNSTGSLFLTGTLTEEALVE